MLNPTALPIPNWGDLRHFLPETVLALTFLVTLLADLVVRGRRPAVPFATALAGCLIALGLGLADIPSGAHPIFGQLVVVDGMTGFFRLLFALIAVVTILFSWPSEEIMGARRENKGEFYALIALMAFGMSVMAAARDIVMLYLSMEMVGLTSYVMAGYMRTSLRSTEASLKYVIFGAVSSGIMLYGLSLLYGLTGATTFTGIREALAAGAADKFALLVVTVLLLAGLGYKIAAVPFHFWCPDVYEGAPAPVAAFFSVGPKAAGFALMIRFFYSTFLAGPGVANAAGGLMAAGAGVSGAAAGGLSGTVHLAAAGGAAATSAAAGVAGAAGAGVAVGTGALVGPADWPLLVAILSVVTMTYGNLVALRQTNLKRLLAYSSIAHVGYLLMGFVLLTVAGLQAILFYLFVYALMNLGAFLFVIALNNRLRSEEISDYAGLGYRSPFAAVMMTIFLFSLTGLPPTAGFIGKMYLFAEVMNRHYFWLAIVGVLNSVVSLFYYMKVAKAMWFSGEEANARPAIRLEPLHAVVMALLALPTLVLGVYWSYFKGMADWAVAHFAG